jgi:hypothetical protein
MTKVGQTGWADASDIYKWEAVHKEHTLATQATEAKVHKKNLVYVDVDTTSAGFTATPRYFVALHGAPSFQGLEHWRTQGAGIVYWPTPTGFR